jgi:hypothetical protein
LSALMRILYACREGKANEVIATSPRRR